MSIEAAIVSDPPGTGVDARERIRDDAAAGACEPICPRFHAAIELVGRRWSGAILCALIEGERRFAELSRAVPAVSDRLLSTRLRELETEGLVERLVEPGTPVRVTYRLTPKGADLEPAIRELQRWANSWPEA
ncbi:MAG TPA: helix-turn-helix domain-containing protein [Solirubrobacterales bacterium]|nr:helix-turn-helix domain-containing protein [Solirubrobacterales bacterium]